MNVSGMQILYIYIYIYSCYGDPGQVFLSTTYDYGTIMSYCHVTPLVPLYLEFHPIVKSQVCHHRY